MKLNRTAFALSLALASTAIVAAPAIAKDKKEEAQAERKYDLSPGARKPIAELQTAINTKDTANIPAKLAAAQAAAKTADDKYIIGKLHLQDVVNSNNNAAIIGALEEVANSGGADQVELQKIYLNLGQLTYNAKEYAKATTYLGNVLKIDPNNVDANIVMAETLNATGRTPEAVAAIRKAIATKLAAGQKPEENWYKRAVALANDKNLPQVNDLALEWVKAYPTSKNWRDALRIYMTSNNLDPAAGIDVSRLMFTAKAMVSEADYFRLANPLLAKGFPGEAKAVLDQGLAVGAFTKQSSSMGPLYASASGKAAGDRASLTAGTAAALAQPTAGKVMVMADAYAGYGDFAKAIELYNAALGKAGADKDLLNLRLGMAKAKSGDKAGAITALSAAGGAQAGIAKLWLTYVSTQG